jgi:hypothetical protein
MNHQKVYEDIICNARSLNRKKLKKTDLNYVYYDNHHIIPECIGGLDIKENKVLLTGREHYVCHKLLTYIYKGNRGLACAFWRMTWDKQGNKNLSSRDYAYARELKANIPMSIESRNKLSKAKKGKKTGKPAWNTGKKGVSKETSKKISESHKGKKFSDEVNKSKGRKGRKATEETKRNMHHSHKKFSEQSRKNMSESAKNRPICSEETRKKLSESHKGIKKSKETIEKLKSAAKNRKIHPMSGKHHSKETIEKMKLAAKNRPPCSAETRKNISESKKGKKASVETIEKLKLAAKNRKSKKE